MCDGGHCGLPQIRVRATCICKCQARWFEARSQPGSGGTLFAGPLPMGQAPESLNRALDDFTQSIVRDSNYAPAYVGLANCYNLLREYTLMPATEAYPGAMAAAKRAIVLDDSLAEAHNSLAFVDFYWSWDAPGAEREFQRAIALDPNSAVAHHGMPRFSWLWAALRMHWIQSPLRYSQTKDSFSSWQAKKIR